MKSATFYSENVNGGIGGSERKTAETGLKDVWCNCVN
jgi:hypothetical protein